MPALRGRTGELAACGTAARHHVVQRMFRGRRLILHESSHLRIGKTENVRLRRVPQAAHAALIAADARTDFLHAALPHFPRPVGIDKQRTAEGNDVGVSLFHGVAGHLRREGIGHDDGNAAVLPDGAGGRQKHAALFIGCGNGQMIDMPDAAGKGYGVQSPFFRSRGKGGGVFHRAPLRVELGSADAEDDGKLLAHETPGLFQHFQRKAHAVFPRASVAVGTPVPVGRKKFLHDASMHAVQFHGVIARLPGPKAPHGNDVAEPVKFEGRQLLGVRQSFRAPERGRVLAQPCHGGTEEHAYLNGGSGPFFVYGVGKGTHGRHGGIVVQPERLTKMRHQGMNVGKLNGDERRPSAGAAAVVGNESVGHAPPGSGHAGGHGGHDDAVGKRQRAYGYGLKKSVEGHGIPRFVEKRVQKRRDRRKKP